MPPSTLATLTGYAQELLTLASAAVADTVGGEIDRTFLSPPGPPFDCEQISVEVISLGEAPTAVTTSIGAGRRNLTGALNLVGFRVMVIRDCIPGLDDEGNFPGEGELTAAATTLHEDLFAVWTRVRTAQREGDLFGGKCDHLFYDGASAIETQGSMAGYQIDFRAEIAGFVNNAA